MVTIIVVLVVLGVVWWLIETQLPIAEPFRTLLRVVIILGACLWLLSAFGVINLPARLR